jgi:hypothetical protein
MKAQTPADGIMRTHDFGDSKYYKVTCGCGQPYHDHDFEVEADQCGVNVTLCVTLKTDYWSESITKRYDIDNEVLQEADWFVKDLINSTIRKIKLTWELWTTGAITSETSIHMSEQQALNYAETLKSAVKDVKNFQNQREAKNGN